MLKDVKFYGGIDNSPAFRLLSRSHPLSARGVEVYSNFFWVQWAPTVGANQQVGAISISGGGSSPPPPPPAGRAEPNQVRIVRGPNQSTREGKGGGAEDRDSFCSMYLPPPVIDSFRPILHRGDGPVFLHFLRHPIPLQDECLHRCIVQETGGERRDKGVGKQDIHSNVPLLPSLLFAAADDDADK